MIEYIVFALPLQYHIIYVQIQMAEDPDPAYTYRNSQGAVRVIRGRGCNDSFRAAVDRSYDGPMGLRNQMETRKFH